MSKLLWEPSEETRKKANITRFISFVNEKHGLNIASYDELYDWSIERIADFWAAMCASAQSTAPSASRWGSLSPIAR